MLVELVDTAVGALLFPISAGLYLIDHGPQLNLILYGVTLGDGEKATTLRGLWCSFSWHFRCGIAALKRLLVNQVFKAAIQITQVSFSSNTNHVDFSKGFHLMAMLI